MSAQTRIAITGVRTVGVADTDQDRAHEHGRSLRHLPRFLGNDDGSSLM